MIVIGQKSGVGFALDPDKQGEVLWQYRAGQGGALGGIEWGSGVDANHAYFPVLLPDEPALHRALAALARVNIHPRRYFFPSLNRLPYLGGPAFPVAEQAASTVLCLPLSEVVTPVLQEELTAILRNTVQN